jgi:type III restriction enzyme
MQDILIYKQKDLVLKVNNNFDHTKLRLDEWNLFIERLCGNREYQKAAIKSSIIYLASGRYKSIEDLFEENFQKNNELQLKYTSLANLKSMIQIPNKLFANIDLATGTGKSYVIYGVAQIMLGLGLVDKVLVLCPSLTIEAGLKEKFEELSGNARLRATIPDDAHYKNPRIIDANKTIKDGDVCVENIHAVYERTGSSIEDSLINNGGRVLVLNDESHHIFNKLQSISVSSNEGKGIKKWKEFLLDSDYGFKYILGFTGTAYHENEYFNDVIFRYSLREAIEDRVVKNIEYVQKDDSGGISEKFQKIYQNHLNNSDQYPEIKPLSILITKDISKAKALKDDLVDFLIDTENATRDVIEEKVLIVTSHKDHAANLPKLKTVDDKSDPVQWVISVSMLTEGWDVKNVFQIVPWEDRAFNSKLLIAQVLGRGLRIPEEYASPQPKVIIFNHDSWSKNIKSLVEEVLEIETRLSSIILKSEERAKFNFEVYNLNYSKDEVEVEQKKRKAVFDYSRLKKEGIKLDSQVIQAKKDTSYESIVDGNLSKRNYSVKYNTWTIEEITDKIFEEFQIRDWEGTILKLGDEEYSKYSLPPRETIEKIIRTSMEKVGISGELLIDKNANKILQSFSTLLRKKKKSIVPKLKVNDPYKINTLNMANDSTGIGNLRRGCSIFYTNNHEKEINSEKQKIIFSEVIEDESLPRSALKEKNEFLFKTPMNLVLTSSDPERNFVEYLCKQEVAGLVESWVKSRDRGFYSIDYSLKYGGSSSKTRKYSQKSFNPDFFIKVSSDEYDYYLVTEIKADKDDSDENKAKYKYAKEHFERLNKKMEEDGINEKYIFHFLSPNGYTEYFEYLKSGILLKGQDKFRCELENLLEDF